MAWNQSRSLHWMHVLITSLTHATLNESISVYLHGVFSITLWLVRTGRIHSINHKRNELIILWIYRRPVSNWQVNFVQIIDVLISKCIAIDCWWPRARTHTYRNHIKNPQMGVSYFFSENESHTKRLVIKLINRFGCFQNKNAVFLLHDASHSNHLPLNIFHKLSKWQTHGDCPISCVRRLCSNKCKYTPKLHLSLVGTHKTRSPNREPKLNSSRLVWVWLLLISTWSWNKCLHDTKWPH